MYAAFYAQDQWTWRRYTFGAALRYDHASSRYRGNLRRARLATCRCSRTASAGIARPRRTACPSTILTPRWQAAWDLFGTGRTAVKWNMGKYLAGAGLNGIYTDASLARRTVNSLTRTWTDANGNRVPDCDLLTFTANGECGNPTFGQDSLRYGRDPASLDAAGTPIGLNNTQCGRDEQGIPAAVRAYCDAYGESLLEGWGRRRYEWQFGLGVQHEVLPRLSAEVTYNHRKYGNLSVTDTVGLGCDLFLGADPQACFENALLDYSSPQYDFFTVIAPSDPRLPNGGGYTIRGCRQPEADHRHQPACRRRQILMKELDYSWAGIDTNFVWRGPRGLRVNGGTSTGRSSRDSCFTEVDGPNVKGRVDNNYAGGCRPFRPLQTRVNGTASYTVPWANVLVSTVFQYQPGVEIAATATFAKEQVMWDAVERVACVGAVHGQRCRHHGLLRASGFHGDVVDVSGEPARCRRHVRGGRGARRSQARQDAAVRQPAAERGRGRLQPVQRRHRHRLHRHLHPRQSGDAGGRDEQLGPAERAGQPAVRPLLAPVLFLRARLKAAPYTDLRDHAQA